MSNDPAANAPAANAPAANAPAAADPTAIEHAPVDDLARRLTDVLNRADRDMSFPNSEPRDAATLIVIDRSGGAPKVLLGRRNERHKFMPGKFVFPGGRVEVTDRIANAATELEPHVAARLMMRMRRPSPAKSRAFAIAAIRETFEETGLIFGKTIGALPAATEGRTPPPSAATRLLPDLAAMHFIARAITPPRRPRRFDTRFFTLDAQTISGRVEDVVGPDAELIELVWLPLTEAERLGMPPITKTVLAELQHRIANGFTPDLPVPFYRWIGRGFTRSLL